MPRQPHKLLSITELAAIQGVPKSRMYWWLRNLQRERGGVMIRFAERGKWFSSLELLRKAMPEMQPPDTPTGAEVASMQEQIAELKAICTVLRNRYRDLRKKVEVPHPKTRNT